MADDTAVVFHYHRLNTYSFNALAGALDAAPGFERLRIDLPRTPAELCALTAERLGRVRRAVVALSMMTCQFEESAHLMTELRARWGNRVILLAGGPHASARPEEVLGAGADAVFAGEAEETFPAALAAILAGAPERPFAGGRVLRGEAPVDLDAASSISPARGMFGPIEITRGCAFACRYCQTSHLFGTRLRHRSVERIVEQARALRSIDRRVVRLLSPNAFSYGSPDGRRLDLAALGALLAALRGAVGRGAKILFAHFPSEARPEHVTEETLALLREYADNDEIVIGAQSGSPRMLEACGRGHTVEEVLGAVALARRRGYKVIVDFIFGLPGEGEEDRRASLWAMERIVALGARVHPHLFAPLPQTAMAGAPPGTVDDAFARAVAALQDRGGIYETRGGRATRSRP
ncbi:MAG: TIGR04013 family B12-binding domain/radical SAM domain-containing protein [Acidobacteria bacterium]|nr:TIGR04013 family B12-binding domain/radical SAM domain-containing protein [Acidobacteriota bacterium]